METMKDKLIQLLKEEGLTIAIVLGLVITYMFLRTPDNDLETVRAVEAAILNEQPTVVTFYANNCSICLISKPKVDRLERDLADQATMLRLNVRRDPGEALAYRWRVAGIPTFFVFDQEGNQVYRQSGAPDVDAIKEAVAGIAKTP
jgi:thiol-disulfide isomerase/thioredoxin